MGHQATATGLAQHAAAGPLSSWGINYWGQLTNLLEPTLGKMSACSDSECCRTHKQSAAGHRTSMNGLRKERHSVVDQFHRFLLMVLLGYQVAQTGRTNQMCRDLLEILVDGYYCADYIVQAGDATSSSGSQAAM